ncbi:hypothetical protein [Tenacibaculum maritimum]|uniref:hypothetical protein n=2 Tax=Tenacibaculum maritimum TaxID=107401 RepID=UPI00132F77D0|nr:hypothetical protein [Tenacibaculum maritimum]
MKNVNPVLKRKIHIFGLIISSKKGKLTGSLHSKKKSKLFSGYQVVQTHKLKESKIEQLPHKNRPSLNKIKHSDFASFFNSQKSDMSFYDFENKDIKLHKRSILFLRLEYENDEYQMEYEIRQFKSSVNEFKGNVLEEKLSLDLSKHYQNE